jgi:flagellar protein FlaG
MGAGTSATQMIFFITSVIIAMGVVGALFLNIQSISTAATMGSKTFSGQLRTDITVINDPEIIPNSSGAIYTFYVKNTGKEDLSTQYITVLIDGSLVPDGNLNKTILNGDAVWMPGDVLQINATVSIDPGSHSLRVITENGIEDSFEFRMY